LALAVAAAASSHEIARTVVEATQHNVIKMQIVSRAAIYAPAIVSNIDCLSNLRTEAPAQALAPWAGIVIGACHINPGIISAMQAAAEAAMLHPVR
jgi:hypothetical protein